MLDCKCKLAQENSVKRTKKGPMLDCKCKLATSKCEEPRRHAPGKQPTDATRTSIPRIPRIILLYLRCIKCVCLEACDSAELLSLG